MKCADRPTLKTALAEEEEREDANLPKIDREGLHDGHGKGTMTFIERGKKTTLLM